MGPPEPGRPTAGSTVMRPGMRLARPLANVRGCKDCADPGPQRTDFCGIMIDVGGEYDPQRHRYERDQRSFTRP